MPYYGDGAPYGYYAGATGAFANHSSLMTGINRYHNPIAARYSPHLSTISESPFVTLRRYSPASSSGTHTAALSRPRRIIDTADIDVSKPPRSLHQHQDSRQQRHRLRRDRPTIKIRSQALKDNPALREYNERHEKSVGELLVEKFLIKDKAADQRKMKLYHQASLLSADEKPSAKENDILAAIRRRVTRRMTRRRSSADVLPLDPEQIEREAALQAAQAEALDSLVAEEQAEIEVEVRRGTFAKRQAMRLPLEISETEEDEDDEMDEEERKGDGSKRHATARKKKKRKSLTEKTESDDEDELEIPESVIEEEEEEEVEFEWDDREKCDDVRAVLTAKKDEPKPKEEKKARMKRTISAPEPDISQEDTGPRFKVEACNSVGDFSTLYVKAAQETSSFRSVEQFRESIRLPAPRHRGTTASIETEVVLPVRKPYVRDTSRNSVYLALKPSQRQKIGADDGSIIIDAQQTATAAATNEESRLDESRSAKCADDRSKIESRPDEIIREERESTLLSRRDASPCERIEDDRSRELDDGKKSAIGGKDEFVSWWDETEETPQEESKLDAVKIDAGQSESVESAKIESPAEVKPAVKLDRVVAEVKEKAAQQSDAQKKARAVPKIEEVKKSTSPPKEVPTVPIPPIAEKKPTSPIKDVVKEAAASIPSVVEKKSVSPVIDSAKESATSTPVALEKKTVSTIKDAKDVPISTLTITEKKQTSPIKDSIKEVPSPPSSILEKKPTSPIKYSVKEVPASATLVTEKRQTSPVKDIIKEVTATTPLIPEKKPTSPNKDIVKEVIDSTPLILGKKSTSPIKDSVKEVLPPTPSILEKKPTSPIKDSAKEVPSPSPSILEKKPTSPIKESIKEVPPPSPSILEKKPTSPIKDSVKEVTPSTPSILQKKPTSPIKDSIKEVPPPSLSIPEKKPTSPIKDSIKEVPHPSPSTPEKKPTSPIKDSVKEVTPSTPSILQKKPTSPIKDSVTVPKLEKKPASAIKDPVKEVTVTTPSIPEKKPITDPIKEAVVPTPSVPEKKSTPLIKELPPLLPEKKPLLNHEVTKIRDHHLPRIPEEPKSASPEKQPKLFPSKPIDKPDPRKKKVDSEAIMKIEKKILEDSESPSKILTGAIPEPQLLPEPATPVMKKEPSERKVGLATNKKKTESSAAAPQPEIDFWSEIRAEEYGSVKLAPKKVQSSLDSPPTIPDEQQQRRRSSGSLKLDLSKIDDVEQDDLKTPLVEDLNKTPVVEEPSTPLVENLSEVPLENFEHRLPNGEVQVPAEIVTKEDEPKKQEVEETRESLPELSGTVKKISKWANQDNLSELNEADKDATPLASKEVSPQVSIASTTTKKKVVKRKKSATPGKKKASEKGETKKVPAKKVAASPQTSQLKNAMSASGSPRNTPGQRPADLNKLFYTTPAILLTATPRDLRKVRRAKVKRKKPTTRTPSLSSDSTGSTRSTATTSTEEGSNCEEDAEQKRLASTRSNDSGFDGSPRLSTPSQSSENQRNADGEHYHHSGRITPPATNLPRFKKYEVTDFNFLKVLGKGSFGKVLLAELRGTECVYAVKCLKKDVVLEDDDVECTLIERKVLTLATRHPYLCHLFCTFQTESHLFFVMEYLNGGDLMFHIQKSGRFSEQRAKFYAAEIWSGLIFLHKKGIVYRDLKLDNVLLDFEGHIRIADFGMCKLQIFLDRTADTFCGTPDYMAPEIIKGLKYNQAVDWWSFGVLLYEMLTGQSPFSGCDEDELFWSICNERPFIPRYLSQSATEILVSLLEKDAGKRIPGHEIACHPFFCTITWDKLERRSLEPPFKPAVEHTLDTRYFDTAFTAERPRLTPVPEQILTSMDQAVFRGFSYTNPNATD